jgi:ATP-binding cassette subfamily B multidrug efflux pump
MRFVGNIGYVFVAVVGGIMVTQGTISIGDVQAFIQYAQQFTQPITQLANIANVIQSAVASAERIFELLDEQEETPEAFNARVIEFPQGAVEFQHVRFGYTEDRILVDGVDITQLKRGNLRRTFGMVLQDTWLFNGTIRDNIAYGHEGAREEEIIQAARAAYADHFIRTLPEGYSTVLNEEATNISQGQKQLLTIARAFLADPAILILDEATSSVDTRTEMQIQKAMSELMKGRTSFVIAHRLSTIRDADLILVMNHGTILEKGTHEELLAKNGFYADLYNSQFTSRALQREAV